MEAKIGDLGLAKHATGGSQSGKLTHITKKQTGTKQYQTKAYLPPEVIRGNAMSIKGDTYSFGVVSYVCNVYGTHTCTMYCIRMFIPTIQSDISVIQDTHVCLKKEIKLYSV